MKFVYIIIIFFTINTPLCKAPSIRSKTRLKKENTISIQKKLKNQDVNNQPLTQQYTVKKSDVLQKEVDQFVKEILENPQLYDTKFLKKIASVSKELIEKEGFIRVRKTLPNKNVLEMLYKIKPNADYSLMFFGGWGATKEHLAPLYELFKDQPCNIFLCETRTVRQNSFVNILNFGIYSEKDVIASIQSAYLYGNKKPIVLWGTCAGGFYVTRALIELTLDHKISQYNIAGFIFDSGWGSVYEAIVTSLKGNIQMKLAKALASVGLYKDYRIAAQSWAVKGISTLTNWMFTNPVSWYIIKPLYAYRSYKTNLLKNIDKLTIPLFFIHSYDDTNKPIEGSMALYEKVKNKTSWWIKEPSFHSMHHFKNKNEYKKRCLAFIKTKILTHNAEKA